MTHTIATTIVRPPLTPAEPVTDVIHGVEVCDPYRWLEDQDSPRTRQWIEKQNAYKEAILGSVPCRNPIRKRVSDLLSMETISEPWKVGKHYFYLKRTAGQQQPAIMMSGAGFADETVLLDPAARGEGTALAFEIVKVSPQGSLLAVGLKNAGSDSRAVEFFDVSSKTVLSDRLPVGLGPGLVFSHDTTGFYYCHEIGESSRSRRAVYFHAFGTSLTADSEVFSIDDSNFRLALFGSSDGTTLGYLVFRPTDPTTFDVYVQDVAHRRSIQKVVERAVSPFCPFFVGHDLLALTSFEARNRRIVKIHVANPEPRSWTDVVPECDRRIDTFAAIQGLVCVSYRDDSTSTIAAHNVCDHRQPLSWSAEGVARLIRRPTDSDVLFYEVSSFQQSLAIFEWQPVDKIQPWAHNGAGLGSSSLKVINNKYRSKDGTTVPILLVAERSRLGSQPLPTLLTAYGGFGIDFTPQLKVSIAFLLQCGFLFAVANVRGGGELGEEWHRLGKRRNRQNAIDDFISAAEWLVESGYSAPGRVAISGGSNAGLLVGAALIQKPELFRAVVCSGPLLDMLRYHRFDGADRWINEYGCSENIEDFESLLAYSPYHNVREEVQYPAVMFISGDADTRCNAMHARKMTARLQAATSSNEPVVISYLPSWGHVPVQPLERRIDSLTDRLAFICRSLDVQVSTEE